MPTWRYIAQRALTGEFLEMELPMRRDELTWELSGAGSLKGTVAPDTGTLRAADGRLLLEEWGTLIYAEADGQIRWGGIVISSGFDGSAWKIEAAGFTTYPHGLPYTGEFTAADLDPADAIRHIWEHIQAHPDGNLGVTVTGDATSVRLGTAEEPYELLSWESPDMGSEIDTLAKAAPLDYVEEHAWQDDDTIAHTVRLGYPRIGRRREDLAFVQGDNVSSVVTPTIDGDDYANEVVGLGAGEGRGAVYRTTAVRDGRLRRTSVYTAKDVNSSDRMDGLIRAELQRRQLALTVEQITVSDHPNAPIGSWSVGDDVLVQAVIPWLGEVDLWCRITSWSLVSEHTATLKLMRSDAFTYGG